jgi:hypothetical protein
MYDNDREEGTSNHEPADSLGPGHIELELVRRVEGRDATHLRYLVSR